MPVYTLPSVLGSSRSLAWGRGPRDPGLVGKRVNHGAPEGNSSAISDKHENVLVCQPEAATALEECWRFHLVGFSVTVANSVHVRFAVRHGI